jgi:hypothetical protein
MAHKIIRKRSKLGNTYYLVVDADGKVVDFSMKRIEAKIMAGIAVNEEDGLDEQPPEKSS